MGHPDDVGWAARCTVCGRPRRRPPAHDIEQLISRRHSHVLVVDLDRDVPEKLSTLTAATPDRTASTLVIGGFTRPTGGTMRLLVAVAGGSGAPRPTPSHRWLTSPVRRTNAWRSRVWSRRRGTGTRCRRRPPCRWTRYSTAPET